MGRLIAIGFVLLLIAGGLATYRQSQTQDCTTGQCRQPGSTSITSKLASLVSPSPAQPPAVSTSNIQQAPSQPAARQSPVQLSPLEIARIEAFEAGKAVGQVEAMKEIERREDEAREEGKETGRIEGEAEGHKTGMELGEAVGYAKAAAEEFRKGQEQGEKFGRMKGTADTQKEMMQLIDEAEREAKARGEEKGYVTGFTKGKETQRRESFYSVAGAALSIASLFVAMLSYAYTRLMPGAVAEYRKLDKERRELRQEALAIDEKYRDWVLTQPET